jgi:hypothetical protein
MTTCAGLGNTAAPPTGNITGNFQLVEVDRREAELLIDVDDPF